MVIICLGGKEHEIIFAHKVLQRAGTVFGATSGTIWLSVGP